MEGCQYEAQFGGIGYEGSIAGHFLCHIDIVAYPAANHVDERTEDE